MTSHSTPPPGRLLGDGWEPHVDEVDGRLIYSIPVESDFVGASFEFEIEPADLAVLQSDLFRRAALYMVLHTILQHSMIRGQAKVTTDDFRATVSRVLFAPPDDLQTFLTATGVKYHIALDAVIAQELNGGMYKSTSS